MNKIVFIALIAFILAFNTFGASVCMDKVADKSLARINKIWGGVSVETRTISGVKLLHAGPFLENYIVAVSDEVEPSEWYVVMETKKCAIKYIDVANDSGTSDIWE